MPTEAITSLQAQASMVLLPSLFAVEEKLETQKDALADALYDLIGAVEENKPRRRLIRLRRDLHNLRSVSDAQRTALAPVLPPELAEQIAAFQAMQQEHADLLVALADAYRADVPTLRKAFQERLQHPDFQKGLLLSSRSLFRAQRRYQGQVKPNLKSKHEKIERGLLRYFTRAAMKATPFARFCAIIPGLITDESDQPNTPVPFLRFAGEPEEKQSAVRLNKGLYSALLGYLKSRPLVRRHLHVELNPTIRNEQDRLLFLAALNGEETFQRLTPNPVLDLIRTLFHDATSRPLDELVHALRTHPDIEASDEEAVKYLEKLLLVGLLRFRTGIREQEADWDVPFRTLLDPIDDEQAQQIVTLLSNLRKKVELFPAVSVDEQATLLDEMTALIDEAGNGAALRARMMTKLLLYVDATAQAEAQIPRAVLTPIEKILRDFVRLTLPLAWPRTEQANMRHFFETYYEDQRPRPLLQFYEDYYREHFKAHLEKQNALRHHAVPDDHNEEHSDEDQSGEDRYDGFNPFGLPLVKTIRESHTALGQLIIERWKEAPDAEEINLTTEDLKNTLGGVSSSPLAGRSVSMFSQLVPPDDPEQPSRLILRNGVYHDGYGKFFSRFLYLFPDTVQEEVFAANQHLTEHYLAEICGDANFNANLHPPLLQWEISYPTGESGVAEQQLPAAALMVEADPDDPHALCLRHAPTGNRVIPVDLGFLNPRMRPPLYQLLMWFMPPANFSIKIPDLPYTDEERRAAARTASKPDTGNGSAETEQPEGTTAAQQSAAYADLHQLTRIWYRPRITFEGVLVLARRCWRLYNPAFPAREAQEADWEYFVRVNRWRHQHGIPSEVFVRIFPQASKPTPPKTDTAPPPGADTAPKSTKQHAEPANHAEKNTAEEQPAAPARKAYTKGSRDFYKPQYIDFHNPLLVGLFGKMTTNLENFSVVFEERYPSAEALPHAQDRTFATELILQLDFPESAAPTAEAQVQADVSYA